MSNYPAMLYRGGMLSAAAADQLTVANEEAELAAIEAGFMRWEKKAEGANKPGVTAPDVAAHAAFIEADKRPEPPPPEQPARRSGKARG